MFNSSNLTKKLLLSLTLGSLLTSYTLSCTAIDLRTIGGRTCYGIAGVFTLFGAAVASGFLTKNAKKFTTRERVTNTLICGLIAYSAYQGGQSLLKSH